MAAKPVAPAVGSTVEYVDAQGQEHAATVTAVPGFGVSGEARLNLKYADGTIFTDVVAGADLVRPADPRIAPTPLAGSHWRPVVEPKPTKPASKRVATKKAKAAAKRARR